MCIVDDSQIYELLLMYRCQNHTRCLRIIQIIQVSTEGRGIGKRPRNQLNR
jgi:hypothetical protein